MQPNPREPAVASCLPWVRVFRAYGVAFGIAAGSEAELARVLAFLPPTSKPAEPTTRTRHWIRVRGRGPCPCGSVHERASVQISPDVDDAPSDVGPYLEEIRLRLKWWVASGSPHRFFLHAGVVSFDHRLALIVGRSCSGKSTLVRELLERGATYYSDEYAVIGRDGRIHPYPQPIGDRSVDPTRPTHVDVSHLGFPVAAAPGRCGAIYLLEYRAGASWRTTALSSTVALARIAHHTAGFDRRPGRTFDALAKLVGSCTVNEGVRGEAADAAIRIERELARS